MKKLLKELGDFKHLEVKHPATVKGGEDKPIIIIDDWVGRR